MRDLGILAIHFIATIARLLLPGGARSIVSESLLLKHQLLILNRSRARAPNLRPIDRIIASLCAGLMRPARLLRSAIVLKPSTLMAFHRALVNRKYSLLFAPRRRRKPGPKGPGPELIAAIVEMKRRNPRFGCRRIAQQLAFVFGVEIDKDVVRRVLAKHCRPTSGSHGPSWLSFLGHVKDSLWSVDLFRCESLILNTYWVMVVMDQFTRRVIGFAVQPGVVDGPALCRMFNQVIAGAPTLPQRLSSDHDPLFEFHRWKANLRILDVSEIKTLPHVPLSHPFVERLIGTVRRELLDQVPFWGARDLERKLRDFRDYYNHGRVHASLKGVTPICSTDRSRIALDDYQWRSHCRGLYQLPVAARRSIRHTHVRKTMTQSSTAADLQFAMVRKSLLTESRSGRILALGSDLCLRGAQSVIENRGGIDLLTDGCRRAVVQPIQLQQILNSTLPLLTV